MNSYKAYRDEIDSFDTLIKKLDTFGVGFLAIVNRDETLFGIVTDGDIRRALLQHTKNVDEIINTSPMTLPYATPHGQIISFLQSKRRFHIPLVDKEGKLMKVFLMNHLAQNHKPNYVVIMAGGLGSRLGELTKDTPKPMLAVKGKPILEYIVDSFKSEGFTNFIFCVNYRKEIIEDYFGDGSRFNINIEYVVEEQRLGTAGALSLIDPDKLNLPFFVANGDVISTIDYSRLLEFSMKNNAEAVMCVKELSHTNPYAEVRFDDNKNLVSLSEKPTTIFHINLGVYLLSQSVLKLLPHNQFYDMPNLFLASKSKGHSVKVFSVDEEWVDIGKPVDYHKISND